MNNEIPNIEIRSKKVRNIIGQVPPYLIRTGFTIVFCIFVMIITILCFYEYDDVIKTTATIVPNPNSMVVINVNVPVNQIEKVKAEQLITIFFDKIPNMTGQTIQFHTKEDFTSGVYITSLGGNFIMNFVEKNPIRYEGYSFYINDSLTLGTEIHTGKEKLINKVLKFIKK